MSSPSFGPALVGVLKPWIVIPRWALGMDAERLRLTFLHEVEHRDARDTSLLLAASLAAALNPWNPAMWWCVRRLRQSVELDCDGPCSTTTTTQPEPNSAPVIEDPAVYRAYPGFAMSRPIERVLSRQNILKA